MKRSTDIDEAADAIAEAKKLLVIAYKGGAYKSKINSALHRLTHAERLLRDRENKEEARAS